MHNTVIYLLRFILEMPFFSYSEGDAIFLMGNLPYIHKNPPNVLQETHEPWTRLNNFSHVKVYRLKKHNIN